MGAFEERVKSLGNEDKLAGLVAHIDKQVEIPLAYIRIEDNVRRGLDTQSVKFQELVASIRMQGLLQNLVVELRQEEGQYQLYCVAGQRRLLAAQEAGKIKANCLIKQYDNRADRIASGLAENLTREDLHCLDIAEGYSGLIANGWTEERIAEHFERNPRTIRRYRTIAAWPKEILILIREHQEIFTTKVIFNEILARRFSSNEELRQAILAKIQAKSMDIGRSKADPAVKQFERELKNRLHLKVSVSGGSQAGKITIAYEDLDQFERLKRLLLTEE